MGGFRPGDVDGLPTASAAALESAYAAYGGQVWRYALSRSRDPSLADDVVQDAFLRLHRELVAGRSPSDVRAWLCRVSSNLIASRQRHERVVQRFGPLSRPEAAASTEDIVLRHESDRDLRCGLLLLRREEREVLLLAASGLRGPEIAVRVGRSHAAVRALLCRARRHLRERVVRPDAGLSPERGEAAISSGHRVTASAASI